MYILDTRYSHNVCTFIQLEGKVFHNPILNLTFREFKVNCFSELTRHIKVQLPVYQPVCDSGSLHQYSRPRYVTMLRIFLGELAVVVVCFHLSEARPINNAKQGVLELDIHNEDKIQGTYYPAFNSSEFIVNFSIEVKDDKIVSLSEVVLIAEEGVVIPFTALNIPLTDKYNMIIENMYQRVLQAARDSLNLMIYGSSFPNIEELEMAYENLANSLYKRLSQSEMNEVAFSIMYHSTIVHSVRRLSEGAVEDDEICTPSPDYVHGKRPFTCEQDLYQAQLIDGQDKNPALPYGNDRNKRLYNPRGRRPPSGRHWGCCGNYAGRCRWRADWCWRHDCICQCCDHWHCGPSCKSEYWCSGNRRITC